WRSSQVEDLNRYVRGTGWTLTDATGIDGRDEVVGTGVIDGRRHAYELLLGPCRVCVESVKLQQQDVRTGAWVDAADDGVVDGNRVDAVVTLRNRDSVAHIVQVKAHDDTRGEDVD